MGRKIVALLLLLVLTIESIGFTVVRHLCSSGHRSEINAINGFPSDSEIGGCCCSDHCHNSGIPVQEEIAFQPTPCCTNIARYIKLESDFYPPVTINFIPVLSVQPVILCELSQPEPRVTCLFTGPKNREHSPPLQPDRFLISIHQLKIAGHCQAWL